MPFTRPLLLPVLLAAFLLVPRGPALANFDAGPWLQNVTGSSVNILYEGDKEDGNGLVEYGTTPAYGASANTIKRWVLDEYFIGQMTGLSPATQYFYRLTHEGTVREGSFFTTPAAGEPFTFVVAGDTRSGHTTHQSVVDSILAEGVPDLYFITGDLVASGELESDWDTFFPIEEALLAQTIFCPVYGNHENGELFKPSLYGRYFNAGTMNQFWYAFSYGNAHFIVINTEVGIPGAQAAFVEDELAGARSNPDIDFIFAFFHQPGATTSTSHSPNYSVLTVLMDLFEEYNVDAVFTGHNHVYEHGIINGVHHIVAGGGGAGLNGLITPYTPEGWTIVYREAVNHYCTVSVTHDSYTLQTKYVGGTVFDSYTATTTDGGFPGATPQDLLDRSLQPSCGSYILGALSRVPDAEASTGPAGASVRARRQGLRIAANGCLYALPGLLILGLRRRMRGR